MACITDYYWTTKDIEKRWWEKSEEDSKGGKVWKKEVRRNFKKLLEKMKPENKNSEGIRIEEDIITFYRTSDGGDFIFQDNETPERMQEVLEMSGKIDLMSYDEKEKLKENLVKLLPRCRTIAEIRTFTHNRKDNLLKRKLIIEEYCSRCREIEQMVESYYIKTRSCFLFEQKLFVELEKDQYLNDENRLEMYSYQYKYLKIWCDSWKDFMDRVISIRKVEACSVVNKDGSSIGIQQLYEDETQRYGTSKQYKNKKLDEESNKKLNKKSNKKLNEKSNKGSRKESAKDKWREECAKLVGKITTHKLSEKNEKDFDYLMVKAFEELEENLNDIREQYLEKCCPPIRSEEEIRNQKIDEWYKNIRVKGNASDKEIGKEDLGRYYDTLGREYMRREYKREGKIDIMEVIQNMSEDDRVELAKKTENEVFSTYTEFKPLEK